MVQNLKKVLKSKISNFFSFLRHEVPSKANNNREAVVVCARHVVKRPSKRSVLVYNIRKMLNSRHTGADLENSGGGVWPIPKRQNVDSLFNYSRENKLILG